MKLLNPAAMSLWLEDGDDIADPAEKRRESSVNLLLRTISFFSVIHIVIPAIASLRKEMQDICIGGGGPSNQGFWNDNLRVESVTISTHVIVAGFLLILSTRF